MEQLYTPRVSRARTSVFALVLAASLLVLAGCRVDLSDVGDSGRSGRPADQAAGNLPALGPIPGSSHWHAAYVVRICDDVLAPFESSDDPAGIHSHGDGVMHVHPFFEQAGFEQARLGLFAEAMGFTLDPGELTLPGGGTWRDGDLCDGVPGRVYVDRWSSDDPQAEAKRFFDDLDELRFEADGEMYQIAFAPVQAPPVIPPSRALLPALRPAPTEQPDPWVDVDPDAARSSVQLWPVTEVSALPCRDDQVVERLRVGTPACYTREAPVFDESAIQGARAVSVNREPGVELQISTEFRAFIRDHFRGPGVPQAAPLVFALEVGGNVVSVAQMPSEPVSVDRLVISGGFTPAIASSLADLLDR